MSRLRPFERPLFPPVMLSLVLSTFAPLSVNYANGAAKHLSTLTSDRKKVTR